MALDMYAFSVCAKDVAQDVQVDFTVKNGEQIAYWRRHHDLHGWMRNLYSEKGGNDPMFDCSNVRLELGDLDLLEATIKARQLPMLSAIFFGNNPPDSDSDDADLAFIARARTAIKAGMIVFYTAWW